MSQNSNNQKSNQKQQPQLSPHDKYFKIIFSKPEVVADILQAKYPQIAKHIDFSTLKLTKTTYVDKNLKQFLSDLVYEALLKNKQKIKIVLIFEHKSYPTFKVLFQLFTYINNIWQNDQTYPFPLTIIIYTGERHWEQPSLRTYYEKLGIPTELLSSIDFKPLFINVQQFSEEQIINFTKNIYTATWIITTNKIYKAQSIDEILELIFKFVQYNQQFLSADDIIDALIIALNYLDNFRKFDTENLKEKLSMYLEDIKLEPRVGSAWWKLVNEWKELGRKEGIELGRKEGIELGKKEGIELGRKEGIELGRKEGIKLGKETALIENAMKLIEKGFDFQTVVNLLEIPEEIQEIIKQRLEGNGRHQT